MKETLIARGESLLFAVLIRKVRRCSGGVRGGGQPSPGPLCGLDTVAVAASFGIIDIPCHS